MDGREKGRAVFGVAGGDAAPTFEVKKRIFDPVALSVERFVEIALNGSVFLRGDHGDHPLRGGLFEDRVGVVAPIRDQMVGVEPVDQG